jgi:ribosomal protein S21
MSKHTRHLDSIIPGTAIGTKVIPTKGRPGGDIHAAIGKWKRAVKDAGIIEDFKDRKEYIKDSAKQRRALSRAIYIQKINDEKAL